MAAPKRKRNSTKARKNKRQKTSSDTDEPYYRAIGILDERRTQGRIEYLVDWAPDLITGEIYTPDWQPAQNCTGPLIVEWNNKKNAQATSEASSRGASKNPQRLLDPPPPPKRKSRVVESSPEPSSTTAPETSQSEPSQTPALAPAVPATSAKTRESPQVLLDKRKSPGASFQYYSQLPASPTSSIHSAHQSFLSSQSSYTGPRTYRSSGIVYDSEEEETAANEENSYVPTTQDASTSAGPSTQQLSSASKVSSARLGDPEAFY
jgi:hypothetical protein